MKKMECGIVLSVGMSRAIDMELKKVVLIYSEKEEYEVLLENAKFAITDGTLYLRV